MYRAPPKIISKLYKFVRSDADTQLLSDKIRTLIVAYCATKVTLIDVMPEIEIAHYPHKKKRKRYQDMGNNQEAEENS